jgi:hypothetical protein
MDRTYSFYTERKANGFAGLEFLFHARTLHLRSLMHLQTSQWKRLLGLKFPMGYHHLRSSVHVKLLDDNGRDPSLSSQLSKATLSSESTKEGKRTEGMCITIWNSLALSGIPGSAHSSSKGDACGKPSGLITKWRRWEAEKPLDHGRQNGVFSVLFNRMARTEPDYHNAKRSSAADNLMLCH